MPGVKDSTFAGATVKYNGIQFGGSEATFDSMPPSYQVDTRAVYDDASRALTHFRHTLTVQCIFFAADTATLDNNMKRVRRSLMTPGRQLRIDGLGLGFDEVEPDIMFGPKPIGFIVPITHGTIATATTWVVEFNGPPCTISSSGSPAFSAFNYSTTWAQDFEGQTVRTMVGYYTVTQTRTQGKFGDVAGSGSGSAQNLQRVADQLRESVTFALPDGFKRTRNVWNEDASKSRMDFSIVDESLIGRAYPPGISSVTGDRIEMSTNPLTFAQADVSLSATMTVAPDRPPSLASVYFLQMSLAKQAEMTKRTRTRRGKAAVIPVRFATSTGLFDGSRTTSFFMQWKTTGCLQDLFFNSPWAAPPNSDYPRWRKSMEPIWGNRGVPRLRELANEDAVFSICDNITKAVIGKGSANDPEIIAIDRYAFPCPDIDRDNSWIDYDVEISAFRQEKNSIIRRAVSAFDSISEFFNGQGADRTTDTKMSLGPRFESNKDTEHIVVQDGIPVQWILVKAKGRRIKFNPVFPKLETIGPNNAKVQPVGNAVIERKMVAKFGDCEIRQMRGYQWYVVLDYVSDFGEKFNPVICQTTRGEKDRPKA